MRFQDFEENRWFVVIEMLLAVRSKSPDIDRITKYMVQNAQARSPQNEYVPGSCPACRNDYQRGF
jgi:hypothetical protein